jgi:hypothetical protein
LSAYRCELTGTLSGGSFLVDFVILLVRENRHEIENETKIQANQRSKEKWDGKNSAIKKNAAGQTRRQVV